MHEPVRKLLTDLLAESLLQIGVEALPADIYNALVEPPNTDLGHLAFGCFISAKQLKKSPALVATELKAALHSKTQSWQGLSSVEAAGPYLNFKFDSALLFDKVVRSLLSGQTLREPLTAAAPQTMIEYSQPNTHKELHVGHMRNLCLGNSLVRLLRRSFGAQRIISATFPGDVGTHVAKCLWYLKRHVPASEFEAYRHQTQSRGEWLGRMYSAANLRLEDEEKTPELYEKNKAELTLILKELEAGQGEYYELWKETRQWSIELMEKVYKWADVQFDRWYWESEVDADSVRTVRRYFAEGRLQQSQGAIGFDFSDENLGFCMLLKSDGTGLYATKDIELARRKFEDFKIEKSVYVVDLRQALHFKQVFKALELLGFDQARNCYHLQYNFVELPDGAMSSRKGNIVPLVALVENMRQHVKSEYLSKYSGEWQQEEINQVADHVAKGAIMYGMLRQDTNKKIVFDMSEWLKIDGESGPFIQYSYARINSLLSKFKFDSAAAQAQLLQHPTELKLMQHLMNFNTVVLASAENYKPAQLCTYLYETAKKFNGFYHDCSVGQAETEPLKQSRLALCAATGIVLKEGLALLGIPVPARM